MSNSPSEAQSGDTDDGSLPDRSNYNTMDSLRHLWQRLGLPSSVLQSLSLPNVDQQVFPSSFQIGHLSHTSIALSALAAALIGSTRNNLPSIPKVTVSLRHAAVEFLSERFHVYTGIANHAEPTSAIGGLHPTIDGYVRIHDGFPNHRDGALTLLGLDSGFATREVVSQKTKLWRAVELENAAVEAGVVIAALRSYKEWDALPQSRATSNMPISIACADGASRLPKKLPPTTAARCLEGLKMVEMSRVIAAPVAGRVLAAHGADVIWVVSPNLPYLPAIDRDFSRGKRIISLDAKKPRDKEQLLELLRDADVFLQGFRPGALDALGLGMDVLRELNPDLITANLSAFGDYGPWARRRGFDSIVQTCSGMNVSEAQHAGEGQAARPMLCQALDHASGYLLATGIMTAVYKRMTNGGTYNVNVSLAGVMKYLRSLGQYEGNSGFEVEAIKDAEDFMETKHNAYGSFKAVKHSSDVEGFVVGWDVVPTPPRRGRIVWRGCCESGF
ncbi:CoA-transferase family III [Hortaea werneckii]|nr:CoA-transferase family III [Hortaea werneckii]